MPEEICVCGKPAHPLYNGKCEDCYVAGTSFEGLGGVSRVGRVLIAVEGRPSRFHDLRRTTKPLNE